jgi:hypothetical protein
MRKSEEFLEYRNALFAWKMPKIWMHIAGSAVYNLRTA